MPKEQSHEDSLIACHQGGDGSAEIPKGEPSELCLLEPWFITA